LEELRSVCEDLLGETYDGEFHKVVDPLLEELEFLAQTLSEAQVG
jgi:hypothetical protein